MQAPNQLAVQSFNLFNLDKSNLTS